MNNARVRTLTFVFALLAAAALPACGGGGSDPAPTTASATLDGSGGTLAGVGPAAGAVVAVPAGALAQPTTLTIGPGTDIASSSHVRVGPAVEIGPAGTAFVQPVQITIPFDPARLPVNASGADVLVLVRDGQGNVAPFAPVAVDAIRGTVTIQVVSLSTFQAAVATSAAGAPVALTLSVAQTTVAEADGTASVTVRRSGDLSRPLVVQLSTSDPTVLSAPSTATILAGGTSASFLVTGVDDALLDGDQSANLIVSALGAAPIVTGFTVTDVETVTVEFGAAFAFENAGVAATTMTVSRSNTGNPAGNLVVTLANDHPDELVVPAQVTIPDNQASIAVPVDVLDDAVLDGSQFVRVTPSVAAPGYTEFVADTLEVSDFETLTMAVAAGTVAENDGPGATTATLARSNVDDLGLALVVTIVSSDASEATGGPTVTIPAGQAVSAPFAVAAVDDALLDGTQVVTLRGQAPGYVEVTDTLSVTDHETLTLTLGAPSIVENAGAAATTATLTRSNTGNLGSALVVTLTNGDPTEATFALAPTIPIGQASTTFPIDAVNDGLVDGTQTVAITGAAAGYVGAAASLSVQDDGDTAGLTVNLGLGTLAEAAGGGTTATTATVTRNTDTTGALLVNLQSLDTSEVQVGQPTVTIAAGQLTSPSFAATSVDDLLLDGTQVVAVQASAGGHADGSANVSVTDFETLTLTIPSASVVENAGAGAASGTIARSNTDDLGQALVVDLLSSDTTEATIPPTVTIPAGQASAPFAVAAVDDALLEAVAPVVTISVSAAGYAQGGSDTLAVNDHETLTITLVGAGTISENGGSTTATVSRSNTGDLPGAGALSVTVQSLDGTEAAVVGSPITIPAGQATSAAFTINAQVDTLLDGTQSATISASATGYTAAASSQISISVTDFETLVLTVNAPTSISEGGATTTGTVTRSNTGDMTSALSVTLLSSDTGEASVPPSVNILANQASANFTITGVDDGAADGTQVVTITPGAAGYQITAGTVSILDDESLAFVLTSGTIAENAGAAATTAFVQRSGDTTAALVVTLLSNDTTEATLPANVTIAIGQTQSPSFNVNAVDDALLDGTQTFNLEASATGFITGTASLSVTDHETLTLTITGATTIREDAQVTTARVARSNTDNLGAALTVNLSSSDGTAASVPASVQIAAGQAQSADFNVTGFDDAILEGADQTSTIGSTATGYAADAGASKVVTVTDHETLTLTINGVNPVSISENGGSRTATVTRSNTTPLPALTVNLLSSNTNAATVQSSVQIAASSQASPSFTISAVDDTLLVGDASQVTTISSSATGYNVVASASKDVTVTDHETLTVTINVPTSISENGGSTTAFVTRSNTDGSNLTVDLASSNPTGGATVPGTASFTGAGLTTPNFAVSAVNDTLLDGTNSVDITASTGALTYVNVAGNVSVTDFETLTFSIVAASIGETGSTTGTVTRNNTDIGSAITINIASNDADDVSVPLSVQINASQASANFTVSASNEAIVDNTERVTITVSHSGYANTPSDTVDVTDNDVSDPMIVGQTTPISAFTDAGTVPAATYNAAGPQGIALSPDRDDFDFVGGTANLTTILEDSDEIVGDDGDNQVVLLKARARTGTPSSFNDNAPPVNNAWLASTNGFGVAAVNLDETDGDAGTEVDTDRRILVTSTNGYRVFDRDGALQGVEANLAGDPGPFESIAVDITAANRRVYVVGANGINRVAVDAALQRTSDTLLVSDGAGAIRGLCVRANGDLLFTQGIELRRVRDAATAAANADELVFTFAAGEEPRGIAENSIGRAIVAVAAVGGASGRLEEITVGTGVAATPLSVTPAPRHVAISRYQPSVTFTNTTGVVRRIINISDVVPQNERPTFDEDIQPRILEFRGCTGCHTTASTCLSPTDSGFPQMDFITDSVFFNSLDPKGVVNRAKQCTPGDCDVPLTSGTSSDAERVNPLSSATSFIVEKVRGLRNNTTNATCGVRMPFGGRPIPQVEIEMLESWILLGAEDN